MEARELHKQKYEAQLHEWKAKLDVLRAQTEKLTAQAKLDVKPHLDAAHAKFDAAEARLREIATATDDKWDDVVKDIDHAWNDLKAAAQGAYDAVTLTASASRADHPGMSAAATAQSAASDPDSEPVTERRPTDTTGSDRHDTPQSSWAR